MDKDDLELERLLKSALKREAAPASLRRRVLGDIAAEQAKARHQNGTSAQQPWYKLAQTWLGRQLGQRWLGAAASFACGMLATVLLMPQPAPEGGSLQGEITASHVRSLMADHLADVASSDKHTVKPWFAGKLDYAPPVQDLSSQGFPLMGGRLDYLGGRPVAALVYSRNRHHINLFVWPAGLADASNYQAGSKAGFNTVEWVDAGMHCWAVSDLNARELGQFARLIHPGAAP